MVKPIPRVPQWKWMSFNCDRPSLVTLRKQIVLLWYGNIETKKLNLPGATQFTIAIVPVSAQNEAYVNPEFK